MQLNDIAVSALQELGVASPLQSPRTEDLNYCLSRTNLIIDGWNTQPGMQYFVDGGTATLVGGTSDYFIAPGQTINLPVPTRLFRVRLTVNPSSQTPASRDLQILDRASYLDARQVTGIVGVPRYVEYIRTWPSGTLSFYPTPDINYPITLAYQAQFSPFVALTDTISFPPGYAKFLALQLAIECAPAFGAVVNPITAENYKESLAGIQALNSRPVRTYADGRAPIGPMGRGWYDIRSDQYI